MFKRYFSLLILIISSYYFTCAKQTIDTSTAIDDLKINQLQLLGSHNSYHLRANKRVLNFLKAISFAAPAAFNPKELDYEHEPLDLQLNTYNLRNFEIDIYADPKGGQFYKRKKNDLLALPKASHIEALKEPGFKVFHIPDVDYNTRYLTLKSMLTAFKQWGDAHPNHLPIYLLIESKEETIADKVHKLHFTKAIPFTPAISDDIDTEIKSIFGENLSQIITPDMVRGDYATLNEAVLANNWPTIKESRGKFIFVMMGPACDDYLVGHPSLKGRAMFTFSDPGNPEAAFLKFEYPVNEQTLIKEFVKQGYIVRTRADEANKQNRSCDYTQMNVVFSSGAQIVTTDYYRADPRYKTKPKKFKNYFCKFPNSELGRIDPVNAADKQDIGKIVE
ncbi:MAG: hypothetical protein JWN78_979 [Bacteroidota bacterium]|nr:hypothetical protein [Bacteroidota bacterium]